MHYYLRAGFVGLAPEAQLDADSAGTNSCRTQNDYIVIETGMPMRHLAYFIVVGCVKQLLNVLEYAQCN